MIQATSGPATVLASGTTTTWFGHGLELRLDAGGRPLAIGFTFAREGGAPRVQATPRDDGWSIHLVDVDAPGRGTAEPMLVGTLGPDLLFLHFRVLGAGASDDRTVHWTLFRVAKADVGFRPREGG